MSFGKFLYVSFVTLVVTMSQEDVFAQGAYTSANNNTGNWETASIWTKQFAWMAPPPPGPTDVGGSYTINVYGYVTRNGSITVSGGATFNIYDTLVIVGNLSVTSSSGIYVHNGGVLVVLGDFSSTGGGNKITNYNGGDVVITGNYNQAQGSTNTSSTFYVYDSTPSFNWGSSVNGTGYNGSNTAAMGSNFKSEAQLAANDVALYNFVNGFFTPLPVSLVYFNAVPVKNAIHLKWATASESNSDRFVIERSADGKEFITVGEVISAGESRERIEYSFDDQSPFSGKSYYRLKPVDLDGSFEYSNVVAVEFYEGEFGVYPNPARVGEPVHFVLPGAEEQDASLVIFSPQGDIVKKVQVSAVDVDMYLDNSGVYLVRYLYAGNSETVRLVIE